MDEEAIIFIVFTAIIPVIVIANMSTFGPTIYAYIAIILAGLTLAAILMISFADFIVFPTVTSIFGITFQPFNNYEITKHQEAVIKNVKGIYYATGFLTANLFAFEFKEEQVEENLNDKMISSLGNWEKATMSIDFPFKFHIISEGLDVQSIRDELEGKRSYQEFNLSRALQSGSANDVIITDIQRKISIIQAQLDRISQGERPIGAIMYFETTAVGVSKKAALDVLTEQIKRLQIAFTGMDMQMLRVVGRELYTLYKFNFMLPYDNINITTYFDTQK
ncbi:MAG: hypothetical protein M1538_00840 [Candidatus Marsarchaeota archaeon]|nr:hypothetical protein [Candidatus Marsarchaeota archaeon]